MTHKFWVSFAGFLPPSFSIAVYVATAFYSQVFQVFELQPFCWIFFVVWLVRRSLDCSINLKHVNRYEEERCSHKTREISVSIGCIFINWYHNNWKTLSSLHFLVNTTPWFFLWYISLYQHKWHIEMCTSHKTHLYCEVRFARTWECDGLKTIGFALRDY